MFPMHVIERLIVHADDSFIKVADLLNRKNNVTITGEKIRIYDFSSF